ncbi:melanoma-associated antigen E1-like isoform X1 [Scyliorhinus canicula]|uniref:melanoma-associated antigen E1-like isoform X1 n=2 Tax=Scyliorhinus canicula TaxID=7830 RepID=UPI0018F5C008|nr:melanoma-associated antigen E1-like isoform X1 [Scyliorhinus canicula]
MNWDMPSEMKTLLLILGCLNCCHLLSADPCVNHTVLDQPWRSTKCANTDCSSFQCDDNLATGWYRFNGSGESTIPDEVVPEESCSTHAPGWLNGTHPIPDDGEVTRKVCFHWSGNPCLWSVEIKIKQCSNYFVYYLVKTPFCNLAYCTVQAVVPTLPPTPETTLPPTPETTLPPAPETTLPPTPETTLPPTPETTLPPTPETTPPPKPETTPPQVASSMIVPNPTSPSSGMGGKQFQLVITLLGEFDLQSMQKVMLEVELTLKDQFPHLKLQLNLGKY